ncbi:MAG: hypothetical protein ABIY55_21555 [Kofleriaceae bacterium]
MRFPLALAVLWATLAFTAPAHAQRVELAGRVTASRTVLGQRRVGEARYVALSDLFYRERNAYLEVLDLETQRVIQIQTRRTTLERRFGVAQGSTVAVPQAEIVRYHDGVVGLAVSESAAGGAHRVWYAELDARTGKLGRTTELVRLREGDQLQVVGADAAGEAAWFAITTVTTRSRVVVLRRLDLATLDISDPQRLPLAARSANARSDHAVQVHVAPDFSRFAVVEYVEDGVRMAPGHVYIIDRASAASFAIPAPPTVYGVAFSADGAYVYLGSAQRGTISRVDLAAKRIDKQVAAPRYLHHLIISASGTKLFALASSSTYAVYDLPDLKTRTDLTHAPGVAPAMVQLSGNGVASLDGSWFVVPDAEDRRRKPDADRAYVIARFVD